MKSAMSRDRGISRFKLLAARSYVFSGTSFQLFGCGSIQTRAVQSERDWLHIYAAANREMTVAQTNKQRGRSGVVDRLLASHLGDTGPVPDGVAPRFSHVGIVQDDPLVGGFSRGSPVPPVLAFRRCSILTSLHPYWLSRPRDQRIGNLSQHAVANQPRDPSPEPRGANQRMCKHTSKESPSRFISVHFYTLWLNAQEEAAVAERLACSIQPRLGPPQVLAYGNRAGRCCCPAGFLGDLPFLLALSYRCCSILTSITPFGSQDLASPLQLDQSLLDSRPGRLHANSRLAKEQDANPALSNVSSAGMKGGGNGRSPRENPPTNGIVQHNSHMRKSGVTRPGIEP
ncbi:hypothetical protein PR048_028893 [Dryococelus australis]|uniref:Uncharacterized protein n=1 Tax=Dryococelus australis TaxID=614101 RepID=A0ABQ9GBU5_9NEOP|nr:hypothetical protein PR048_028893 [Dryococelus australis]